jgi:hypothetical protein
MNRHATVVVLLVDTKRVVAYSAMRAKACHVALANRTERLHGRHYRWMTVARFEQLNLRLARGRRDPYHG